MATLPLSSRIEEEEWDRHKPLIVALYLGTVNEVSEGVEVAAGQTKGKTLNEVADLMKSYGFNASAFQFESKLTTWGARKNLKPEEWGRVHDKLDMLPQGTKTRVLISGRAVADSKIKRARRYRKQKSRATNGTPARGSPILSTLPECVRIEIQEPDGRWARLPTETTPPALISPHLSRPVVFGEMHTAELCVPSTMPMVLTSPKRSVHDNHHALGVDLNFNGTVQEFQLTQPSVWLDSLPSRRILRTMRMYYGFNDDNAIGCGAQTRCMPASILNLENATIHSRMGNNPASQAQQIMGSSQNSPSPNERNQRIMSTADISRLKSHNFLLSTIMGGMCLMEDIPEEVLDGLLGPSGVVDPLLLNYLTEAPHHLSSTLASILLEALIFRGKRDIIAQLLENGLIHADNTVIFSMSGRLTPLEAAAKSGSEMVVELFLAYGGDPNRSYGGITRKYCGDYSHSPSGALEFITMNCSLGTRYQPSLNIIHKLFDAGAEVRPSMRLNLPSQDMAIGSMIFLRINVSQHEEYFGNEFFSGIFDCSEDTDAADQLNRIISNCLERHSGRCLSCYQKDLDWALTRAALKGRTKTFHALSPHSTHTSSVFNEELLIASIRGGQSVIINSILMERRPNINPSPRGLIERYPNIKSRLRMPGGLSSNIRTTPLAEAIRAGNTELVEYFASSGIFESLHKGDRFGIALAAAAEVGNANLVVDLLNSCPDLESQTMMHALAKAIEGDNEALALLLLEEGASAYRCPGWSGFGQELASTLTRMGSRGITTRLLTIGYPSHLMMTDEIWCVKDLYGMEDYLSSLPCVWRFRTKDMIDGSSILRNPGSIQTKGTVSGLSFGTDICGYLLLALKDEESRRSVLNSKLATEQFLTACLAIAVCQDDSALVTDLINRGANASDEMVLAFAAKLGTEKMLQLLLSTINHQRPVLTRGLRTEVLKEAIKQGPDKYESVRNLIESGLVDIFDSGASMNDSFSEFLTPLGVAIRAGRTEAAQKFSYDVVSLLLDHGCDPNGVVAFVEHLSSNQTAMLGAIDIGNRELVELLIKRGADVNPELRHLVRRTPLQKAAEKGDVGMVQLLLRHRANVNAKPAIAMGGTALQFAAISGNCDVACELLSQGAFLYMPPPKIGGRWPIEGAAEHGKIEMVQFLWQAKEETLFTGFEDNGFREKNFKKAMRLARDNHHYLCVELIAELAKLPITATDVPPVVSPIYVDWPPPQSPMD